MDTDAEFDVLLKVVIWGESEVGKSALVARFADKLFPEEHKPTIGIDFKVNTFQMGNYKVRLQLWDTAGQERFRPLTYHYLKGADVVVIVFDVTKKQTFDNLPKWLQEVDTSCPYAIKVLVGNKTDKADRQINFPTAKQFASSANLAYIETSAKTNTNVLSIFEPIVYERNLKK